MHVPEPPPLDEKKDITLSIIFHIIMIAALTFFAAHEGMLGTQLREFAVVIVPKPKPVKPQEAKPKPEPPKQEIAKKTETPPPPVEKPVVEPPKSKPTPQAPPVKDVAQNRPALIVPTAPPPAAIESGFIFEGGRAVETSSDPVAIYRGLVEYSLYSYWNSPKNVTDPRIYAEVEILVDEHGNVSVAGWKQASGNKSWDASIREVFQQVHKLRNPPPSGFPHTMVVRFDMAVREQLKNI